MKSNQKIKIAILPFMLLGSGLLAQNPPLALPNAPEASSPLVASSRRSRFLCLRRERELLSCSPAKKLRSWRWRTTLKFTSAS
jgi:hypothetical protein